MNINKYSLGLLLASPLAFGWSPIVDTNLGQIEGKIDANTNVWQGVQYAAPPVGELRWQPPQSAVPWQGVKATVEVKDFVQVSYTGMSGAEDALTLDIYRPNNDDKDLPVLFYVHGGNNQSGSSSELTGQQFVNELGVVLVSVNYRLGVLGFNPLPAITAKNQGNASGNFGLMDLSAAMDWVDENIVNFGGDKDNMTVAGFSAGGRDVLAMLISPLFKDKFERAISLSGGMTVADEAMSATVFSRAIAPLVVDDGVKENLSDAESWLLSDADEVYKYLMGVDAGRLAGLMAGAGIRMSHFPHLYTDGKTLPEAGFESEEINSVPLILLSGTNEFTSFSKWEEEFMGKVDEGSPTLWNQYQFVNTYGNAFYHQFNTHEVARTLSDSYKAPIYVASVAVANDPFVVGQKAATVGSYHGIWKPLLTQQPPGYFEGDVAAALAEPGAVELSSAFREYLKQFVHSGELSAQGYSEWPRWDASSSQQLVFDASINNALIYAESNTLTNADILVLMDSDRSLLEEDKQEVIQNILNGRWFSAPLDSHYKNATLW